jgi:hypothetical protein
MRYLWRGDGQPEQRTPHAVHICQEDKQMPTENIWMEFAKNYDDAIPYLHF